MIRCGLDHVVLLLAPGTVLRTEERAQAEAGVQESVGRGYELRGHGRGVQDQSKVHPPEMRRGPAEEVREPRPHGLRCLRATCHHGPHSREWTRAPANGGILIESGGDSRPSRATTTMRRRSPGAPQKR